MNLTELLLTELDREAPRTRRVIDALIGTHDGLVTKARAALQGTTNEYLFTADDQRFL